MEAFYNPEVIGVLAGALVVFIGLVLTSLRKDKKIKISSHIQIDERQRAVNELLKEIELESEISKEESEKSWFEKKERELQQTHSGITLPIYIAIAVVSVTVIFGLVYMLMQTVLIALPFSLLGLYIPNAIVKSRVEKNIQQLNAQMIKALRRMSSTLRAGGSLKQAIEDVAKARSIPGIIRVEFRRVLSDIEYGDSIERALYKLYERTGSRDIHNMALAVEIQRQIGGNIAELFDNISQTITNRNLMERDVRATLAQASASTTILSILPFAIGGLIVLMNPGYFDPLFASFTGRLSILICICFILTGMFIMKRVSKIDM